MAGELINERYLLKEQLGVGGMGKVYLARDKTLDRDVALKVLSTPRLGTEGRSRLLAEAQTVAKLSHPNIVTVFDAGEVDDQPFIVMEYIQGTTLNKTDIEGFKAIIEVAKQICTALQYAHEQDIVHRDLKPENVIIQPDGVLRLMDFGLAVSTSSRLTENGLITGTVAYMSPEQAFGYEITPASDLYSLGVMLYELTTNALPFEAEDALAIITQHIHAPVVPPRAKNDQIPSTLNDLIVRLLNKDPLERPGSAAEVLEIIEQPEFLELEETVEQDFTVLDRIVRGRIIGRQAELEEAKILWRRATQGQGQTLLISGEPGIGKTRLMREILTNAEVSGGISLVGECYAESNSPYSAFAQITRKALDMVAKKDLDLPGSVLADLLSLTPDIRFRFPEIEPNPRLDPESEQQRLFENMVLLCSSLGSRAPLLVVVDDAHWADSGTVTMLHHLIRRTQNLPVMILATYREVELKESRPFNEMLLDLNRQRLGYRIKLERLDKEATHQLLKAIFAEDISDEFLEGIYRETNGNPFFIEEVCRALVESGAVYYEDGEWQRVGMDELQIPQGVQVAVEYRLTNLPREYQDVLRMASIIGREFSFDILSTALEMDEDVIIDGLEAAEEAQMIREVDGHGDVTFIFVHALVPSAIADSVRTLRRRKLHKRVAAAIETENPGDYEGLAYHFGEAGDDSQAIKYYRLAGERAAAAFANQDAENYFQSALDLVEDAQDKATLLAQMGLAQAFQSKNQEALETWREAINLFESLDEIDRVAELYARSTRTTWDSGDTFGSLAIAEEGLSKVSEYEVGPGLARLFAEYSRACYFNGKLENSGEYSERGLKIAEDLDLVEIQVETLTTLGLCLQHQPERAIDYLEKAAHLADRSNLPRQATRVHNNLAIQYMRHEANFNKAMQEMQTAAEIAHRVGDRDGELFFHANLGMWQIAQGQIKQAEQDIPRLKELSDSLAGEGAGTLGFDQLINLLILAKGNFDQALDYAQTRLEKTRLIGDLQRVGYALEFIVQIAIITGDLDLGKQTAEEYIELAAKDIASAAEAHSLISIIYSRQRDPDLAKHHYEKAAEEMKSPMQGNVDRMWSDWAESELLLAEQKKADAWNAFERLYKNVLGYKFSWYAIWLKTEWGFAMLQHGDQGEQEQGRHILEEASEEFQSMGADGFVDFIKEKSSRIASIQV
jgi:tetratricopeptide (TPR) repeat protein/predicted Ser/Thr protein kinase